MKRYLLFSGSNYYPKGGWDDFVESFDTTQDAIVYMANNNNSDLDWWHIVDLTSGKIVG